MMKRIIRSFALAIAASFAAMAQTSLTQTTLAAAATERQTYVTVASASGITTSSRLYIYDWGQKQGELVAVKSVSGTQINITSALTAAHASGAVVVIAPAANAFKSFNPRGACTSASFGYTPWINTGTGEMWLCSSVTGTWVPGFNNLQAIVAPTAAVASVAGSTLPSGPLFHVTGTNAITGWTLPVGFHGGSFTAIFDSTATWTAAGNINNASLEAMTAGCAVTFTYDSNAGKFYSSTLTCNPTP